MRSKSILIVEDDETIRETFKLALEAQEYSVFTAANGKEGLETLQNNARPCLILLDLMMPVMDGWGFMDALGKHAELASIPVVIVTAYGERHQSSKAKCVLKKPVDLEVLLATVRQNCGSP